jgi:hypothetical protein
MIAPILLFLWCRRPDLNRHGFWPLPPQDSVSTKFHHFGTFENIFIQTDKFYFDWLAGCDSLPPAAGGAAGTGGAGAGWAELCTGGGALVTTESPAVR